MRRAVASRACPRFSSATCCATGGSAGAEPARPGAGAGRVGAAPELPGDGPLAAEPRMVLRLAGELDVPLRERNRMLLAAGLRARLRGAAARLARAGAAARARSTRCCAPTSRSRPLVDRPLVEPRGGQRRRRAAHEGVPAELLARNVLRDQPAPGRPGAADRQPRRVARPPAGPAAPRGRGHGRRRAGRRCSRRRARTPAARRRRTAARHRGARSRSTGCRSSARSPRSAPP